MLFSIGCDPPSRFTAAFRRGSLTRIGALGAVATFAFALFFQSAHLGYEIDDNETGSFRSRYTSDALASAARDRLDRWRERPPIVLHRLSREDQYMSEALWHVRRRNAAWNGGEWFAA